MSQREIWRHCAAGFENREGPQAKEHQQSLEARKDKETDSPLQPPEGAQPC